MWPSDPKFPNTVCNYMHTRQTHPHLTLSLGICVSYLMFKFMTFWNLPGQLQTDNILWHMEQQSQCLSRILKIRHPINIVICNRHRKMKPFMEARQPVTYFKSSSPLIFHFQDHGPVIIVSNCMLLPQFTVKSCHHLERNCYSVATSYQKKKRNNSANIAQFSSILHPLSFVTFCAEH